MPDAPSPTTVTDLRVLAALSHPARRRLLDALFVDGPSTVSVLAAVADLAIGSASHHLGVLDEAGLIEAAPDLARDRRERWWRAVPEGLRWSTRDFDADPAGAVVAQAAASLNLEHHVAKVRAWQAHSAEADPAWRDAAFASDFWLSLTADELAEVSEELNAVLRRWHDRNVPDDDGERTSVFVFAHGVPARP
jgi:DNA-binding transcriptional ArsR family regulator